MKRTGTEITFTFGFFAMWAFLLSRGGSGRSAAAVFFLSLLHESGHCIAALLTGTDIRRLTFYAGGISMKRGEAVTDTFRETVILSAGCAANFAAAAVLRTAGCRLWAYASIGLGLFNLLPFSVLDGGRLIKTAAEHFFPCADTDGAQRVTDIIILVLSYVLFAAGATGAALPAAFTLLFAKAHMNSKA